MNYMALERRYRGITDKIKKIQPIKNINIDTAKDGNKIITIEKENRTWYLNSRWKPDDAAEIFADRYCIRKYGIYFIFGLSDGRHVRKLLERCDKTNCIVVFEPDSEIFIASCSFFDLEDIIDDERLKICVRDITGRGYGRIITSSKLKMIEMCILPVYDILYREFYEEFEDDILVDIQSEIINRNTNKYFGRKDPQYLLYHMKNMINQRNPEQLRRKLEEYDLTNIPAIIVSAGPSLDKNVNELKKAQGKAALIVVDAALKTVIQAGIRPDIVCSIDFKVPNYFFEEICLDGLIWSAGRLTKPWILEQADNKVLYNGNFKTYWNKIFAETAGYLLPDLLAGGSVSTEAFVLAFRLGFKKIILVGQDLAFTNGVSHTKGVIGAFGSNKEYMKGRAIVQVEGINGEMLDTDFQMFSYKQWFERLFRINAKKLDVINATEGGAKIEGACNRKLKDVIEEECKGELDLYEIIQNLPPTFKKEQQEELLQKLKSMEISLQVLKENIEDTLAHQEAAYERLNQMKPVQEKEIIQQMIEDNNKVGLHELFDILLTYTAKEEYDIAEDIYKEEMGIHELLEKSLILYHAYRKAVDLFAEDIEEYIMKDS